MFKERGVNNLYFNLKLITSTVSPLLRMVKHRFYHYGCITDFNVDRNFKMQNPENTDYKFYLLLELFTVVQGKLLKGFKGVKIIVIGNFFYLYNPNYISDVYLHFKNKKQTSKPM